MHKPEAKKFKPYLLLVTGLLALVCSFGWGTLFYPSTDQKAEGERIYRVFEAKEKVVRSEIDKMAAQLKVTGSPTKLWLRNGGDDSADAGLYYTVSRHDTLLFWSSSLVAFDLKTEPIKAEGNLVKMPTGWFYIFSREVDGFAIKGFMLIKRDFPYQNRYVHASFQEAFNLSDQCEVVAELKPGTIQVFCHEGKFHFGIQFRDQQSFTSAETTPGLLFFLLFVLLIAAHFSKWVSGSKLKPWVQFGFMLLFAVTFYLVLNYLKLPDEVFANKLFAPSHFAWIGVLSSLGDYLLLSILLFVVAHSFFVIFRKEQHKSLISPGTSSLFLFAACYFVATTGLILVLLNHSDLSLELYSNYALSIPNILATGCIALQVLGLGVVLIRVRCVTRQHHRSLSFFVLSVGSLLAVLLVLLLVGTVLPVGWVLCYIVLLFLLDRISVELLSKYKLTSLFVFGLLLAFGLNLVAQFEIEGRRAGIQQVMAVNLATERDPAAEIFLSDFETKILKDTLVHSYLVPPYRKLEKYLKEIYFNGFWNNYELQVTVCTTKDSVYLPDDRKKFPCQDFFDALKLSKGVRLPGSDFYFMDRLNGRISYLGELHLSTGKGSSSLVAFVELNSKIIPEGKGYPQLLMDQQAAKRNRNEGYSYAKYFDNKLVDRGGSFQYDPAMWRDIRFSKEFSFFEKDGFLHCVYRRSGENYVVVSYPVNTWVEKGRGFPPMFFFIYLLGLAWILLARKSGLISSNRFELRGKIQFTLVSTLLVLLFLIGLGLIRYNYQEFQRSMKENLDQRVRAISSELGLRIGNAVRLDSIHDYLGDQLVEISDITWTDINIYDLNGKLAASSRYEIFEQGLTSERIDPRAFFSLNILGSATFLHNENLGKMAFFSVYAPLYNSSQQLAGYVNLPYFNRQDDFTRQVSGFIIAFINLYILLVLLTMVVALVISTKLTAPLLQIEQKLKGIALGKQNATIEYLGDDEIGRLVKAYNKKVAELADSAALLARSERESAWKEMARQIAHEINNPLTPMKLNIQYLQKMKDQGAPNFDAYFNQVTGMLVGQIDALSAIASAFSDFARLPSSHIEPVEMVGLIREVAILFEAPDKYSLKVVSREDLLFVSGDRIQLRRALVNILRNATQAIQDQVGGAILVSVEPLGERLKVAIRDNGSGIPDADRERLFEPNFTTKSGGMGLGLAITKSILENYKAEIDFQSEPGQTIFFLDFPLLSTSRMHPTT